MESIKRFSKKKVYDVTFFDIDGNICGKANGVSNISNVHNITSVAYNVCSKMPRYVIIVNTDGTEWAKWWLSLDYVFR